MLEIIFLSIIFSVGISFLFFKLKIQPQSNNGARLPPGSNGWPFIGETLEYLSTAKRGVPEKFFTDRFKIYASKVFKTSILFRQMAVLRGAEGNKFLFSNENKLVRRWWQDSIVKIFHLSTESKGKYLEVLHPFLKPDALQNYISPMDIAIKHHLKTYWSSKEVMVYPMAKKCAFSFACQLFLNLQDPLKIEQLETPMNHVFSGLASLPINLPGSKFSRANTAAAEIRKEIERIVNQRRIDLLDKGVAPKKDLVTLLLIEDGKVLTDIDIANFMFGLLIGAYHTLSITIVSIMKYLAELPHVYDEVLKEQREISKSKGEDEVLNWNDVRRMKYLRNVISESLRLTPPSSGTFREALTDFTYEGFFIPKGWKFHWNAYVTHKDPEYFPNPEKFDPTRFDKPLVPFSYVPFGGGPHMCPGGEYARVVVLVFIHNVVKNFKWELVRPDEKLVLDPVLEPLHGLPVRLYPNV